MTGIIAGTAALVGAAFGWSGALVFALLTVLALAIWSSRPPWANCAVAMVAVVLGAWRRGTQAPPVEIGLLMQGRAAVVVTAPVFTGQRQYFAVEPLLATDRLTLDGRLASA